MCLRLDVATNTGLSQQAERFVRFAELGTEFKEFRLSFVLREDRRIEYRAFSSGQVALHVGCEVSVERAEVSPTKRPKRGSLERAWENEREFLDGYLRNVSGVIHVGANTGQERRYYWLIGVDVIWVEPIKEVYDKLVDNLAMYTRQRPINALLGARDGEEVTLGIANNGGASSSILPLEDHSILFPDIKYGEQRRLKTVTLGTLLQQSGVTLSDYQALTLDTEGAELMILTGAGELLEKFEYIKCEVADFPARTGTPTTNDLDTLLVSHGFRQLARRSFSMGPNNSGTYWDIVWKRVDSSKPFHDLAYNLPIVMNPADVDGIEKCD